MYCMHCMYVSQNPKCDFVRKTREKYCPIVVIFLLLTDIKMTHDTFSNKIFIETPLGSASLCLSLTGEKRGQTSILLHC